MASATIYVFDAYGTLFDVHAAVRANRDAVGPQAERLSELWRVKQLEYTWVRSLMDAYADFQHCTAGALDWAARMAGIELSDDLRARLLSAYDTLAAFPEVKSVLGGLKQRGARNAILSNGTPGMLAKAVRSAGIESLLDAVISVDPQRVFKTAARVYATVTERYGVKPGDISFQSSNRWDIAGAKKFGFRCVWINRAGAPDEYLDLSPDRTLRSLEGLLD
jgi:2-haloacid dehalogenase